MRHWRLHACLTVTAMAKLKRERFLAAVTQTRSLEKKLLTPEHFERMMRASEFGQIRTILRNSGYRNVPEKSITEAHLHTSLNEFLADFFEELMSIAPADDLDFFDLLFLSYDVHNIQAALMRRQMGEFSFNRSLPVPRARFSRYGAILTGKTNGPDDFYTQLLNDAKTEFEKSPRAAQEWLDKAYFKRIISVAKESEIPLFAEFAEVKADFYNIRSMLRLRRMKGLYPESNADKTLRLYMNLTAEGGAVSAEVLAELFQADMDDLPRKFDNSTKYGRALRGAMIYYSQAKSMVRVERDMDNYLTDIVRARRNTAIGPEALFGYMYARCIELLNLRLVFAVRVQGLSEKMAQERLRNGYV